MVAFYIALAIFTVSLLIILTLVKRNMKKQEEEFNRTVKKIVKNKIILNNYVPGVPGHKTCPKHYVNASETRETSQENQDE